MLSDLVVLELASVLAGPSTGQFLAELGARVIKVERPGSGDVTRSWRLADEPTNGISAYFACCNYGKESVALDLRTAEGTSAVLKLAAKADVVITSYRPGQAERLGIGVEVLCGINKRLIHASVTAYGPDDDRPGYDAVLQAETGFMYLNGPSAGPPTKMPVALVDVLAAHQLKQGILLALMQRERTGLGSGVTVSLADAAISALVNQATNWLTAGHDPERIGSGHPNIVPYGRAFGTRDGSRIVLAIGSDAQFSELCRLIDQPAIASDPRFVTNRDRVMHRDALNTLLDEAIGRLDHRPLLGELANAGVPAGAVRRISEVLSSEPGISMRMDGAVRPDGLRHVAFAMNGQRYRRQLAAPPELGADTDAVLRELA